MTEQRSSEAKDFRTAQFSMIFQERLRRSSQQFQYVKLSLINVGLLSVVGAFSSGKITADQTPFVGNASTFVIAFMLILSMISLVLFLLWIDDAILIGGIDNFLKHSEGKIFEVDKGLSWFLYREELNKTKAFKVNKHFFNLAIVISFVSPPFLISVFILLQEIDKIPMWVPVSGICIIIIFLVSLLAMWRKFTKNIYD